MNHRRQSNPKTSEAQTHPSRNTSSAKTAPHPGEVPLWAKHRPPAPVTATTNQLGEAHQQEAERVAGQALRSPGQPLDVGTRAFMESRFGQDFSNVRIHTDARAAASTKAFNAHAYTVGEHIVFGDYRPNTLAGRAVLAHELAHTIQQRGAQPVGSEQPGLEAAANQAAARVTLNQRAEARPVAAAPAIQFLRVTNGGFGRALEEYTNIHAIADNVIRLLLHSRLFMSMAQTLDTHYVWRTDSYNWEKNNQPLQYDAQHRITNGPRHLRGKRELMVVGGGSGAAFEPFDAPGNNLSSDIIVLNPTSDAEFLRSIAHEAAHARNFVGQSGPPPATLAAAVAEGIQEEIDVRDTEQQVVSSIAARARRLNITFGAAPTTVPAEVEREFSPGLGLTYLENIFFNWRLREAQTSEGLTDDEAISIREQVDRGLPNPPFILGKNPNPRSGLYELSEYAEAYFNYKTAQRKWRELRQQVPPDDPRYPAREEQMRQDHARRFFGGRVAYRPLPVTTP